MPEVITLRMEKRLRQQLDELSKQEDRDRSEIVRELLQAGLREKKLAHALELYKEGRITLWKAARTAGVSLWRMIDLLRERKIELQYSLQELRQDFMSLEG